MKKDFSKFGVAALVAAMIGLGGCTDNTQNNQTEAGNQDATSTDSTQASSKSGDAAASENKAVDPTILRFSHFWPATSAMHAEVFEPWAQKVEADSNGEIEVEIYPSATLSKPDVMYESAQKGVIDIGSQAHGYTAGRFPLTQIAELPGLSSSSSQMSCMLQTLYDDGTIASEYEDTHLLFLMGSGPAALHTAEEPIRKPSDMKGLRIRRPSAIAGDIIEKTGGTPVGLPATDIYTSLQRGVIDGLSFPWQPTGDFRLVELAKAHTNIPFYSSALLVTMNKDKYESLPAHLQKVLDDNSGRVMADLVGKITDRDDAKFRQLAEEDGHTMVDIPNPLSDPEWKVPLEAGTQKYLNDVKELGLDADGVYEKVKQVSADCEV